MDNNLPTGLQAKEEGMTTAAIDRNDLLKRVREALKKIAEARYSKTATADDAQAWLNNNGYKSSVLGNAAGSLFTRDWQFTGEWVPSVRKSNHAHQNRVWRLVA